MSRLSEKIEDVGYEFAGDAPGMLAAEEVLALGEVPDIVWLRFDSEFIQAFGVGQTFQRNGPDQDFGEGVSLGVSLRFPSASNPRG